VPQILDHDWLIGIRFSNHNSLRNAGKLAFGRHSTPFWRYRRAIRREACKWKAPDTVVLIPFDTVAYLDRFKNIPCAVRKARGDLVGAPPYRACVDQVVSVSDDVETISAFQGNAYSFAPSNPDPCNALA
jgi:hypothetical protein